MTADHRGYDPCSPDGLRADATSMRESATIYLSASEGIPELEDELIALAEKSREAAAVLDKAADEGGLK